jgi:hypothetical protein
MKLVTLDMIFITMFILKISVINSNGSNHPNKEEKLLGSVYIPYAKGGSENFKLIGIIITVR